MKKIFLLSYSLCMLLLSCQKSVSVETHDHGTEGDSTLFSLGDTLTYEVITTDTGGWFGLWTDKDGELGRSQLDNGTWGSPVYKPSGWKYSFAWNGYASQLMMSAFTKNFQDSLTINIYRNNELIKSVTGFTTAKTIYNVPGDILKGTTTEPLLTYEVLIDQMDSTVNQYDAWNGNWFTKDGVNVNDENTLTEVLPMPSGWRYTFKPAQLPFTMNLQAWPFSLTGARVTLNLYVNGALVKSAINTELTTPLIYEVQ